MNQMLTILAFFISLYRSKGDAPGSVPQPNIAFAPCPSACDGKCVDTCPDYCCVKGAISKTSVQSQPAQVPQLPQVIIAILLKPLIFSLFGIMKLNLSYFYDYVSASDFGPLCREEPVLEDVSRLLLVRIINGFQIEIYTHFTSVYVGT